MALFSRNIEIRHCWDLRVSFLTKLKLCKVHRELGVNWKTMVSILRAYRSLYSPYEVFDYPFDRG